MDRTARTIVLSVRGVPLPACRVGQGARDWLRLRSGEEVRATIREVLTVYVAPDSSESSDARVLAVDPSYRVLTLEYPNGTKDALKIGLYTPMTGIEAGDSVTIRPVEVIELRVRRAALLR